MNLMPKMPGKEETIVPLGPVSIPEFVDCKTIRLNVEECQFVTPIPRIKDSESLTQWLHSPAYNRLLQFIQRLNKSVMDMRISDLQDVSPNILRMTILIQKLIDWIDAIPPLTGPQRFGNRAFKIWFEKMETESHGLLSELLEPELHASISEILVYFQGFYTDEDASALVLQVFQTYLKLVRKLQQTYMLEAAGSHGVWGLDDFQFLSYYWGSAQLLNHKQIRPKSILQPEILEYFSQDYMYLGCIKYIMDVKKGPFFEHSPILYDISGVPLWSKVNSGMLKMFVGEVLAKYPVVQHFVFGFLLPFQ